MTAPGAGRNDTCRAGVVEDGADPVAVAAEQSGEDEREFGKHILFHAAWATDHHGCGSVEDEPRGQLTILVEFAYLRFIEPSGDVPVDVPRVVAFDVRPQPGEVETSTSPLGAIPALDAPVESPHDPPLQPEQQPVRRPDHFGGSGGRPPC